MKANQMLTFQPEREIEWQMSYDENENLTSITNSCGTTTYTWDARNHLVAIEGVDKNCNPLSASFKYDALGRRIEKTINGRKIQYLYDGLDIVKECIAFECEQYRESYPIPCTDREWAGPRYTFMFYYNVY